MITMKKTFHGIAANVEYTELPIGVNERNIEAALFILASDSYEQLGGIGQDFNPEIKIEAHFGEYEGLPTLEAEVENFKWKMVLVRVSQ